MQIDFGSRSFVTAPFEYGLRHGLYVAADVYCRKTLDTPFLEKLDLIRHLALAILNFIPVVGHLVAFIEKKLCERSIRLIKLQSSDPFEQGKELGKIWKDDLQRAERSIGNVYQAMWKQKYGSKGAEELEIYFNDMPREIQEELRGIAESSGVSLNLLILSNAIIDDQIGCTIGVFNEQNGEQDVEVATNCFRSEPRFGNYNVMNSFQREDTVLNHPFAKTVDSLKKLLDKVNNFITVQAMVFDGETGDLHLATGMHHAANRSYRHFTYEELFGKEPPPQALTTRKVMRTLDWLLPMLGPYTDIVVAPATKNKLSTARITWPGISGAYSSINEAGVFGALTVVPRKKGRKEGSCPNGLIFRQAMEVSQTVEEMDNQISKGSFASHMNWVVSAPNGTRRYEITKRFVNWSQKE